MQALPSLPLALFNLGTGELVLIFALVLLLFGAKRLPELARGFGKSIREFKKASSEAEADIRDAINQEPPPAKPAAPKPPAANPPGNN